MKFVDGVCQGMSALDIVIISHHPDDDKDCGSDEYAVSVTVCGYTVAQYGDSYHDKGYEKAIGFVDAIKAMGFAVKLQCESRPDCIDGDIPEFDITPLYKAIMQVTPKST